MPACGKRETAGKLTEYCPLTAVNFGQYDYSGIVLNRSPMIRRRIPEKGTHAYKARGNLMCQISSAAPLISVCRRSLAEALAACQSFPMITQQSADAVLARHVATTAPWHSRDASDHGRRS